MSLPAGLLRMPRWEYLLFTVIGSGVWNCALVGAGWALGTQWERVSDFIGPLATPLLIVPVLVATVVMTWRAVRRRAQAREPA